MLKAFHPLLLGLLLDPQRNYLEAEAVGKEGGSEGVEEGESGGERGEGEAAGREGGKGETEGGRERETERREGGRERRREGRGKQRKKGKQKAGEYTFKQPSVGLGVRSSFNPGGAWEDAPGGSAALESGCFSCGY